MAATVVSFVDGTWGTLSAGGTTVVFNKWDLTLSAKNTDTPASSVPGFSNPSPGMRSAKGNLTINFDGTNLPTYAPAQILSNLIFGNAGAGTIAPNGAWAAGTTVPQYTLNSAIIDEVKITNTPGESVTYDIAFSSKGAYVAGAAPAQGS